MAACSYFTSNDDNIKGDNMILRYVEGEEVCTVLALNAIGNAAVPTEYLIHRKPNSFGTLVRKVKNSSMWLVKHRDGIEAAYWEDELGGIIRKEE